MTTDEQVIKSDQQIADAAYEAFWRAQEAGETERDRGGYYGRGFRDGYATALLDVRDMSNPLGANGGE